MHLKTSKVLACFFLFSILVCSAIADDRIVIHIEDFETQNEFNSLSFFGFEIIFDGNLKLGVNENPPIAYLEYHLVGQLPAQTPSGITVFHLTRIMDGEEFYGQGSSMIFEISDQADMSDGIQFSELVTGMTINAVEFDTGQYHSPLVELHPDGTGTIQNSNNSGGTNDETGMTVDVDFGEEYVTNLVFDANNYTLSRRLPGDVNGDCQVNLLDVQPFVDALTNPAYDEPADINGDGSDDLLDVVFMVQALLTN